MPGRDGRDAGEQGNRIHLTANGFIELGKRE